MAAKHYKLDNLIAIVDRNGLMIDGRTEDVMSLEPFADKWRAFWLKCYRSIRRKRHATGMRLAGPSME